ncbi:MAG: hypothetical protein ACREVY_07170 [Gammaproteobacteria bacterium]
MIIRNYLWSGVEAELGQFESWAGNGARFLDAMFYIARGLVLLLLLLFFIR